VNRPSADSSVDSNSFPRALLISLLLTAPAYGQAVTLTAAAGARTLTLSRDSLPATYLAPAALPLQNLNWQTAQPGLSWTELELQAGRLRIPVRAVIARIDPRQFDFELALLTRSNGMTGTWTVDSVTADVAFALNAGQFKETGPWGWLVMSSYERRDPGFGPVSAGIAFDTAGALHWIAPSALKTARANRSITWAFQSYPLLIFDGRVPALVRHSSDVDRGHRDARLILAQTSDGLLFVILTRYDALGAVAGRVPIGLTVPESVVLAGALGAKYAVMLDGGLSAQLLIRDSTGTAQVWRGTRSVPLGLVARPRKNR